MFEVSGAELLDMARQAAVKDPGLLLPGFDASRITVARQYRVALPINVLWSFSGAVQPAPRNYWITDLDAGDAVERLFPLE
jgi:hypothetical protein